MHILTVADFFYPGVTGGASIVIYEVMRRLVAKGHQVTFLIRQQPGTPPWVEGMQVFSYEAPEQDLLYPLAVGRCFGSLRRLLQDRPIDLINAHHAFSGLAAELIHCQYPQLPSVFFFHGPWHREAMVKEGRLAEKDENLNLPLRHLLRRGIDRFVLSHCTQVVGLSNYMRAEAERILPDAGAKFRLIPGGVDTARFVPAADKRPLRRQLGLPENGLLLLTVRRLAARMGLENLVRAMARVERERGDVTLVIGGSGELRSRLEHLIAELGLERTHLVGYITDQDLPTYYQASDLFVMPSLALEGFGLSTLEALASGVPVLGTPIGGTPEILSGVLPDFILAGTDPESLAEGILGKLPLLPNPELSLRVRRFAEGFDWQRITDAVEGMFVELHRRR